MGELADPSHPGQLALPSPDPELEPIRALTVAAEGRRRTKLREDEQLPVKWKLADYGPSDSLESQLRRSASEPGSIQAKRHKRGEAAWFSSHGIHFDAAPGK